MADEVPVEVEGVRGRVSVRMPGVVSGVALLLDGAPAPQGGSRLTYALPRVDGATARAQLKLENLGMKVTLDVDGRSYAVGKEQPTWLAVLAWMPLVLIGVGGALGGLCGGVGAAINQGIVRRDLSPALKALACLGVTVASWGLWLVLAAAFHLAIGR